MIQHSWQRWVWERKKHLHYSFPTLMNFIGIRMHEQFMERMFRRIPFVLGRLTAMKKQQHLSMSRPEVVILASIIEKETNKNDEKARISGVYVNRLDRNWLLQADPTLVYASGDFGLTRVLNVHKEIDSPYNTYMYPGTATRPDMHSINFFCGCCFKHRRSRLLFLLRQR